MEKVLNLYAGIGGNRKLWRDVDVTAVEINEDIAAIYQDFFPDDKVIVGDAHKYLLDHFKEFDFIWSSPPCPSHSKMGFLGMKNLLKNGPGERTHPFQYPDMKLYQELLFLHHFFEKNWVVENVKPYYDSLIKPQYSGRHCFWSNYHISNFKENRTQEISRANPKYLEKLYGFDLTAYKSSKRKDQVLRNCVNPKLGLHVFNSRNKQSTWKDW